MCIRDRTLPISQLMPDDPPVIVKPVTLTSKELKISMTGGRSVRCVLEGGDRRRLQGQMIEGVDENIFPAGAGHEDRDAASVSGAREARKRPADAATFAAIHPDRGRVHDGRSDKKYNH